MDNEKKSDKVTLNLALTVEDKKFLKIYALEHDTTVSEVIHEYVQQLRKAGKDKK